MVELTSATRKHIATLFPQTEVERVEDLLARECAENLPLLGDRATPAILERFRFAALRVSGGNLHRLREAIALAKVDWRDLLVAAGVVVGLLGLEPSPRYLVALETGGDIEAYQLNLRRPG